MPEPALEDVGTRPPAGGAGVPPAVPAPAGGGLWRDAWRELRRKPQFWLGALLGALFVLVALAPQLFTGGADPRACDLSRARHVPSAELWFGADQLGCDYFVQVAHGARNSLVIGVAAVLVVLVLGVLAGAVAGFYGGVLDAVLSRLADVFYGLPLVLGALVLLKVAPATDLPILAERGPGAVALALSLFGWMTAMRLVRAQVLAVKHADHVAAARAMGASNARLLLRHILPDAVAPVVAYATVSIGLLIAAEATLTYLGVGLTKPAVSWGLQIDAGQPLLRDVPHLALFPGLALFLTVAAFVLMGDALRDALDPRRRG